MRTEDLTMTRATLTLFDPALGLDVRRTPDQIDAHPAGGRA